MSDLAPAFVCCRNLTRYYGKLCAVDDLSLNIARGELFGFLGPNGAGKTTTIKMMTGLLRPTSGTVTVAGYDIQTRSIEARTLLGYVPDNPFLYEKLTGAEFLHFMAELYTVPLDGRAETIGTLLARFELDDRGNDLISNYSRGMRQKIALAGALIHNPRVIFLDEPTVGLDPRSARLMRETLKEECRRGVTVIISTHILPLAEQMCSRFAVVKRGRLVALGTIGDLRRITGLETGTLEDLFLHLTEAGWTEPTDSGSEHEEQPAE